MIGYMNGFMEKMAKDLDHDELLQKDEKYKKYYKNLSYWPQVIGASFPAILGGIIGGMGTDSVLGGVAGAGLGGLAGGALGHYLQKTDAAIEHQAPEDRKADESNLPAAAGLLSPLPIGTLGNYYLTRHLMHKGTI